MTSTFTSRARFPRAAGVSYDARQVAAAYGCPVDRYDGRGVTIGVIELGGALNAADLGSHGANVTVVAVDGATMQSDPQGADGEVMLDVEVIASVAPGAHQRVYFAPNTDSGFIHAVAQAATECDYVTISWGGPENSWSTSSIGAFSKVLASARAAGVVVFAASGDTGSRDSTTGDVVDYPAADPNVVGCGGTKLLVDGAGRRVSEVVWDENDTTSATGGGVSRMFPGRHVPDVAGNADPVTGYRVTVDGHATVIGGTSAVAPLYAAMCAVVRQAFGRRFDFLALVLANPAVCYDVTIGDNGGFRAGPGRDDTTGLGVVDMSRFLTVLQATVAPTPGPTAPTPAPPPPSSSAPVDVSDLGRWLRTVVTQLDAWLKRLGF